MPGLVSVLGDDRAAYGEMGLIIGAVICVLMLICFAGTHGARCTEREEKEIPLTVQARWIWENKPLLTVMAMKAMIYMGISSFIAVALFFLKGVLKKEAVDFAIFGVVQTVLP